MKIRLGLPILPGTAVSNTIADNMEWGDVYTDLLPKVYNYFRYRVGDGQLAEDLTAVTFEKAWGKRHRYRRDLGAFSTWIFTIACNTATDYYRKHREILSLADIPVGILVRKSGESVEETVQRHQDSNRLTELLAQLPPRERELIALKYGAELTNRKIAELAGLTESNVGTIIHRVVKRLHGQWES